MAEAGSRWPRRMLLGGGPAALGAVEELRPGALVNRYRRCGKPTCHCAQPADPGHMARTGRSRAWSAARP